MVQRKRPGGRRRPNSSDDESPLEEADAAPDSAVVEAFYDRLRTIIHAKVTRSVATMGQFSAKWPEAALISRVSRYIYKAASAPEVQQLEWEEACKQIIAKTMQGYTSACGDEAWFFHLDLAPAFLGAANELFETFGRRRPHKDILLETLQLEFQDLLDRQLLDKAMWQATEDIFGKVDAKAKAKVHRALAGTYWTVLDEVLIAYPPSSRPNPKEDLASAQAFMQKWLNESMSRAWSSLGDLGEDLLTEDNVYNLFVNLVVPYGQDESVSCLPPVLVQSIGNPPADWPALPLAVQDMFRSWGKQTSKKKRKTASPHDDEDDAGEDVAAPPPSRPKTRKTTQPFNAFANPAPAAAPAPAPSAARVLQPRAKAQQTKKAKKVVASCFAGQGHPECTSSEDCIGSTTSRLVQHLANKEVLGDLYCEPCWCTFVRRNPALEGVFKEKLDQELQEHSDDDMHEAEEVS